MSASDIISGISAVVAVAALIRPDVTSFIKKRKSVITIDALGYSDFGYSLLGPTIGVMLSFYSKATTNFLRSIDAEVTNDSGRIVFKGEWYIFRSTQANSTGQETWELANSTVLREETATKLNILFCDNDAREKINSIGLKIKRSYSDYIRQSSPASLTDNPYDIVRNFISTTPGMFHAMDQIKQILPWHPGKYTLKLTHHPLGLNSIEISSEFHLDESDVEELRNNVYSVIFSFANPNQYINYNILYKKIDFRQ